jgi:hypothetical protein
LNLENTKPQDVSTGVLIGRLRDGWTAAHGGWAQELAQRWAAKTGAHAESLQVGENTCQFVARMPDLRLRGMDNVPCLILTGERKESQTQVAQEFWRQASLPRLLPFVFALSDSAESVTREVFPRECCLLLTCESVKGLLGAQEPQAGLKELLWQQIPRRRLNPYNLLVAAEGGMFFGRCQELDRLRHEDATSFAIAGPGRIGKTSLLTRYRREMLLTRDGRAKGRFQVSFFDCNPTPANSVSRFLAMHIDSSKRSAEMTDAGLFNFLKYQCKTLGSPLDLLLDEVDLVCESAAFKALGAAARSGFCRLVLFGKGVLLKTILSESSLLGCRVELMHLGPLNPKASRDLILLPLRDLGFSLAEPEEFLDRVLRLTGCLPYLLQFYGQKLAQIAIEEKTDTISLQQVEALQADFVTAQYFVKPLNDLEDSEARLIGLSLLKEYRREYSIPLVQEISSRLGIDLDHKRATEICNDLVINNILAWKGSAYRIANEGLYLYARDMGYLSSALGELKHLVTPDA